MKTTKVLCPEVPQFDSILKFAIAPRPICFASTVDQHGNVNLSPFSYFNIVSHNPPICVFSPLRRMRDNSTKHSLDNLYEVPELVINIVNYNIVQQQSLASTEYPKEIDEFQKSGLTAVPSVIVRPPRVAESPVQLECRVQKIIPLGDTPGAGNLVLAEILLMHIHEDQIDDRNHVDQSKFDLVARLGANWYCRVTADNLFEVDKPLHKRGVGVDQLPAIVRNSTVLTGNHLGILANVERLPSLEAADEVRYHPDVQEILNTFIGDQSTLLIHLHHKAAELIEQGDIDSAWKVLLLR